MHDTLSKELELLVDDFADEAGNWALVLEDAGYLNAPTAGPRLARIRPRLHRRMTRGRGALRLAAAAAVIAAAVLAGISVIPDSRGCSGTVLNCASAAIAGDGSVVHMVFSVPAPSDHPGYTGYEVWYDTQAQTKYTRSRDTITGETSETWSNSSGIYSRHGDGPVRKDPKFTIDDEFLSTVVKLFGTYKEQLRTGHATLAGETTYDGKPAYAIDILVDEPVNPVTGKKGRVFQQVLVDRDSYQPLAWALATDEGRTIPMMDPKTLKPWFTYVGIQSAGLEQRDPAMFEIPKQ